MGVSWHTVHTHIKTIHRKAGVSTTGRVTSLAISETSAGTVYAGTKGNGIFRLQLPISQGPPLGVTFRKRT